MLVVVDAFSKFVHLHPMRAANTNATIKCLKDHMFLVYGAQRYLITDNGTQFTSTQFKFFLKEFGVTTWYTSRYHPQANPTEAANKTTESAIRAYLKDAENHRDWDANINEIACAMNTAAHTSTLLSLFITLFGRHMETASDDNDEQNETTRPSPTTEAERRNKIIQLVKANLKKNYNTNKQRYDKRAREIRYNIGDEIWVKTRVLSSAAKGIISKFQNQLITEYVLELHLGWRKVNFRVLWYSWLCRI